MKFSDSLGLNYIMKVFLFFLCMSYEQRYYDAKSVLSNFTLRNTSLLLSSSPSTLYGCNIRHERR